MIVTQVVDVDNCREKAVVYKGMALAVVDKLSEEVGSFTFGWIPFNDKE